MLECSKGKVKVLNRLGRWIQYLTFSAPSEIQDFAKKDQIFSDVIEAEKMFRSNPEDMAAYLSEENAKLRFANILKGERFTGREEGEANATRKMARDMLKDGVDVDFIKKYTHLSDAELAAL